MNDIHRDDASKLGLESTEFMYEMAFTGDPVTSITARAFDLAEQLSLKHGGCVQIVNACKPIATEDLKGIVVVYIPEKGLRDSYADYKNVIPRVISRLRKQMNKKRDDVKMVRFLWSEIDTMNKAWRPWWTNAGDVFDKNGKLVPLTLGDYVQSSVIHRRLVYGLRHAPEHIGVPLDNYGYAVVDKVIRELGASKALLSYLVRVDNKGRLEFNEDQTKIRAVYGHSIAVSQKPVPNVEIPEELYHGTNTEALKLISGRGIVSRDRNMVHMADDFETAWNVAKRRKDMEYVVLTVKTADLIRHGHVLRNPVPGIWLVDCVPADLIDRVIWESKT